MVAGLAVKLVIDGLTGVGVEEPGVDVEELPPPQPNSVLTEAQKTSKSTAGANAFFIKYPDCCKISFRCSGAS
jgi:hypothetical protein